MLYEFLTQSNLHIFIFFRNFVNIQNSNAYNKLLWIYAKLFFLFPLKKLTRNLVFCSSKHFFIDIIIYKNQKQSNNS